jgi:hypothetical protein
MFLATSLPKIEEGPGEVPAKTLIPEHPHGPGCYTPGCGRALAYMTVKTKTPRTIRLVRPATPFTPGVFCITDGKTTNFYTFHEIACEIGGRGFALHRLGLGSLYHVRVGNEMDCSCECLGFLRHGRCKHILGLLALINHGQV